MLSFELSERFLNESEQDSFASHLLKLQFDKGVWNVFSGLFNSTTNNTKPFILRAFHDRGLTGAIILIKCRKFGKALFQNKLLASGLDSLKIPFYLWIRMGCCMDMMSNPGFVRDPDKADEVLKEMIRYMQNNSLLFIVTDYISSASFYSHFQQLPALPHALINCSNYLEINEYLSLFKNIRRKIRVFALKGGSYKLVRGFLDQNQRKALKKCFESTAEHSVFYLPYQDLYLQSALNTSSKDLPEVYYFIAELDQTIIGYQAAIKTGKFLNALHGAFDRNKKSTYHAYDILFVKMTEFAIENKLQFIDFGAVINQTKQKMINQSLSMNYFLSSKYSSAKYFFKLLLKVTKIQGKGQMRFR